ncbi:MAG: hypothetical protein AAF318_17300 [Pseudomonadota bacterium]
MNDTLQTALAAEIDERLDAGSGAAADLITVAGKHGRLTELRRATEIDDNTALGLALMIAHARAGRPAEALAQTPHCVTRDATNAVRRFAHKLEAKAPPRDGPLLTRDGTPVIIVASYPRSGNTRFLNIVSGAFPRARYTAFMSEGRYVSPHAAFVDVPGPVTVKDHVFRSEYRHNPVIALLRDGRDCALSHQDFLLRRPGTRVTAENADSLGLATGTEGEGPLFGGWPAFTRAALEAKAAGHAVEIVRYPDLVGPEGAAVVTGALTASGLKMSAAQYEEGLAFAQKRANDLRTKNVRWERTKIYPEGTLLSRWVEEEGDSTWRAVFADRHRRALHEAGFTEPLLAAGFESDPNWWSPDRAIVPSRD